MRAQRMSVAPTRLLLRALIRNIEQSFHSSTHLGETEAFLHRMRKHFVWYDSLLVRLSCCTDCPVDVNNLAVKMIGQMVYELIEPVKGLCEGTTERIPFVLATYLNHEFRCLCPISPSAQPDIREGIALFPVPNLNYFYVDVGWKVSAVFEGLDQRLESNVLKPLSMTGFGPAPSFPPALILVGFQYAMVEDMLFNTVLFHELGHHIFAIRFEKLYRQRLRPALDKAFKAQVARYKTFNPKDRDVFLDTHLEMLISWADELFSDLTAAALVGPQFAFALHDLSIPHDEPRTFTMSHPADEFRAQQLWELLTKAGWLRKRRQYRSAPRLELVFEREAHKAFQQLKPGKPPSLNQWIVRGLPRDAPILIHQLTKECQRLRQDALKVVTDARERAREFWLLGPGVFDAFKRWVVPSTIITSKRLGGLPHYGSTDIPMGRRRVNRYHPRPSTVMNVARVICQSGLSLGDEPSPSGQYPASSVDPSKPITPERISQWTQKAVADWLLIKDSTHGVREIPSQAAAVPPHQSQESSGDNTALASAGGA